MTRPERDRQAGPSCGYRAEPTRPDLLDALGQLASSVAIATCATTTGGHAGIVTSSLTTLSTRPPRILFCMSKAEPAHADLLRAEAIQVSVLSAEQEAEARTFSDGGRFGAAWTTTPGEPPRLARALATLRGYVRSRMDGGTHTVVILDLFEAETGAGAPLVRFRQGFERIAGPAQAGRPTSSAQFEDRLGERVAERGAVEDVRGLAAHLGHHPA